jgi:hypothetical protein
MEMHYKAFLLEKQNRPRQFIRSQDNSRSNQIALIDHAKFDAEVPPRIRAAVYAGGIS